MVKIRIINRNGDTVLDLGLEEARQEIQGAINKGYIPMSGGKAVSVEDVKQDDEVALFPMGIGG